MIKMLASIKNQRYIKEVQKLCRAIAIAAQIPEEYIFPKYELKQFKCYNCGYIWFIRDCIFY